MLPISNRLGSQTITFDTQPRLDSNYTIVGPLEGKGPHALDFREILSDDMLQQKTPEKAERLMLELAIEKTLSLKNTKPQDLQFLIAGDLSSQLSTSALAAGNYSIPFMGIYGACSTFAMALGLGGLLLQGGFSEKVLIATSSHYQTAERQFRYPLELNIQHTAVNHYTVTGAAAVILAAQGGGPFLTHATFGSVIDWGLKDASDLGSAMAPAAFVTLKQHLSDTQRKLEDYDLILTGDLGKQGAKMLRLLLAREKFSGLERLEDGGSQIYGENQKTGAGGSGAACIAVMTLGYLLNKLISGKVKRALIVATGAMLSALSVSQGESIPCVAHAIALEA